MQSFQFLINSMKAFTTAIWEFEAGLKSVCANHCLCFSAYIERLVIHTHTHTETKCVRTWHAFKKLTIQKPLRSSCCLTLKSFTLGAQNGWQSVLQLCAALSLYICVFVCVCVLNLAVDLSLLSALCTLHTAAILFCRTLGHFVIYLLVALQGEKCVAYF